jgi:hypothetical protein
MNPTGQSVAIQHGTDRKEIGLTLKRTFGPMVPDSVVKDVDAELDRIDWRLADDEAMMGIGLALVALGVALRQHTYGLCDCKSRPTLRCGWTCCVGAYQWQNRRWCTSP